MCSPLAGWLWAGRFRVATDCPQSSDVGECSSVKFPWAWQEWMFGGAMASAEKNIASSVNTLRSGIELHGSRDVGEHGPLDSLEPGVPVTLHVDFEEISSWRSLKVHGQSTREFLNQQECNPPLQACGESNQWMYRELILVGLWVMIYSRVTTSSARAECTISRYGEG